MPTSLPESYLPAMDIVSGSSTVKDFRIEIISENLLNSVINDKIKVILIFGNNVPFIDI
jgi:hypothetical protein